MNDLKYITDEFGSLDPFREAPDYWLVKPKFCQPFIDSLKGAEIRKIGESAGKREIIVIEYGEKEDLDYSTDNLASAIASTISNPDPTDIFPTAFYGAIRRRKPVLVLQGGIHGGELSGTAASLNLCQVIETGKDCKGKEWPLLQELARKSRIVIIPWLNPDGTARWPIINPYNAPVELYTRLTAGILKDGTPLKYPSHKNIYPIPPVDVGYMGSYFNDKGYNLQYDLTTIEHQPETKTWMRYYLDERPDAVVILHCNGGSMVDPDAYVPEGFQHQVSRIAGLVRQRLVRDGYHLGRLSWAALPGLGTGFLNQMNGVYHISGALPIMCEMPAGASHNPFQCEEIIDIGLVTLEEILFFAHHDGLRPYEFWPKVKKQLGYE